MVPINMYIVAARIKKGNQIVIMYVSRLDKK